MKIYSSNKADNVSSRSWQCRPVVRSCFGHLSRAFALETESKTRALRFKAQFIKKDACPFSEGRLVRELRESRTGKSSETCQTREKYLGIIALLFMSNEMSSEGS